MKINHKLFCLTGLAILALLLVLTISNVANDKIHQLDKAFTDVKSLEVSLLTLRRNEKDFLARFDLKYKTKFQDNYAKFESGVNTLEKRLDAQSIDIASLENLMVNMAHYKASFLELIFAYETLGLSHADGHYKNVFEQSERLISALTFSGESASDIYALILKAELFALSNDPAYFDAYTKQLALINRIDEFTLQGELAQFNQAFQFMYKQKNIIGLAYNAGLKGEVRNTSREAESLFSDVESQLIAVLAEEKQRVSSIMFGLVAVLVLLVTALSIFINKGIQRSINSLSRLMSDISSSHNLTLLADDKGRDEIAEVASNFNRLMSSIRQLISGIQSATQEMGAVSLQLQNSSQTTESALSQQQVDTDSVASAVIEMGESIKEVAATTANAATNAERGHQTATEGLAEISSTKGRMTTLSNDLSKTSEEVLSLASLSDNITTVLDVIREIAEQTNLLALNAAIEAARAGEQGRGFAVVADEVRTLAGRTQQSTEEISHIINSLQGQTKVVVDLIGHCRTEGEQSTQQASSAEEMIKRIMADMEDILNNSNHIDTAVEQQSIVAAEIGENVTSIRDVTADNSRSVHDNSQAANVIASQAKGLDTAAAVFQV